MTPNTPLNQDRAWRIKHLGWAKTPSVLRVFMECVLKTRQAKRAVPVLPLTVCLFVSRLKKGVQSSAGSVQRMVTFKSPGRRKGCRDDGQQDQEEDGVFDQQNYIQALGTEHDEGNADFIIFNIHYYYYSLALQPSSHLCAV